MIESNRPQAWRLISIDEVDSVELMSLRVLPTVPIYDIRVETDRSLQSIAALIAAAPEMEALLRSEDAGQGCDYGDTPAFCPMPTVCWRHRRDALLARIDAAKAR